MAEISLLKKEALARLAKEEQKLIELGYSLDDLQLLRNVVEYIAHPIISDHFSKFYGNKPYSTDLLPGQHPSAS